MTLSAEAFLKNGRKYLNNAVDSQDVITVATDNGNAILMDAEAYARQQEILETIRELNEADEEFARGEILTTEEVFANADRIIAELQAQQK
jgi:PHD/YefM family antitoxin component YafN of YafNO toxin-antitoxin module